MAHDHAHAHMHANGEKVAAARFSIYSNTLLTVLKLIVGIVTGSVSVVSEAAHSATDLLASWIAFFSVRVSDRPADEEHPYGHGKIESISGLAEALLIFGAAGYIVYEAVHKILKPGKPDVELGVVVMAISAGVNILVSRYLFAMARKTDSLALEADAEHLRTDVYTSVGVLLGLILVKITGNSMFDPIVAIVVAFMIVNAAWRLTKGAVAPLVDATLPEEDRETVREVLEGETQVLSYHKLRTRKSGSMRHVDAHILLDDNLSLHTAHELTEALEDRIRERLPNTEVTLHTEPYRAEQKHQHERHGGPPPEEPDEDPSQ